jgi:hypothetical protein
MCSVVISDSPSPGFSRSLAVALDQRRLAILAVALAFGARERGSFRLALGGRVRRSASTDRRFRIPARKSPNKFSGHVTARLPAGRILTELDRFSFSHARAVLDLIIRVRAQAGRRGDAIYRPTECVCLRRRRGSRGRRRGGFRSWRRWSSLSRRFRARQLPEECTSLGGATSRKGQQSDNSIEEPGH